jgi:omega-amidase
VKIAAVQLACTLGDVQANLNKIRDFCARAKQEGVDLIVFPEAADTGYSMPVIRQHAKPWTEGAVPALREMAKEFAFTIVSGVAERVGDVIYNSQVFIDPRGQIAASYRKTHLFVLAPNDESTCYAPGDRFVSVAADGFRFGLSICYDLRFPEVCRALALEHDANVMLVSSAWPLPRAGHLRALAVARAIENQSYLILANRVGVDAGVICCGTSAIIDPSGVIIASASDDREEMITGDVSEEAIAAVRDKIPVFTHRRTDLYGRDKAMSS